MKRSMKCKKPQRSGWGFRTRDASTEGSLRVALFQDLDGFGRQVAERVGLLFTVLFHRHGARIARVVLEGWDGRRVANLGQRFDGGRHNFRIRMGQKLREQFGHARLANFGQDVRELGQGVGSDGVFLECTLHSECNFLEAFKCDAFECFAGREPAFRRRLVQHLEQEVHALGAVYMLQQRRNSRQTQRLLFWLGRKCGVRRGRHGLQQVGWGRVQQVVVQATNGTFSGKELVEAGRGRHGAWPSSACTAAYASALKLRRCDSCGTVKRGPRVSLVLCACALAVCAWARTGPGAAARENVQSSSTQASSVPGRCPEGSLDDDGTCIALRDEAEGDTPGQIERGAHRTKAGRWDPYDQIPLLADRPTDYQAYRYPVPPAAAGTTDRVSGYDLDKPDDVQRRGLFLRAVGHGAIDLMRARGTPVRLLPLRAQVGDARGIYAGHLIGNTVVTEHARREGSDISIYLVFYGHLNDTAARLGGEQALAEGTLLGHVGDSDSPGLVHLHLEVRRWRGAAPPSATLQKEGPGALLARVNSIVCDPRNVLPLRSD